MRLDLNYSDLENLLIQDKADRDPTLGNMRILIYRKYNKCRKLKIRTNYRKTYLESITSFKAFLNKKLRANCSSRFVWTLHNQMWKTTIHLMIGSHCRTWLILRAYTIFWESVKDAAANIVLTDLHTHILYKYDFKWMICLGSGGP